jgi:hypothetical protein
MSPYKLSILLFHLFHSCQSHDLGRLPCTSGNNLRLYDMELPYGRWSSAVAGKTSSWKRINTEWHSGPSQLSPYAIQSVDVSNSSGVKLYQKRSKKLHISFLCVATLGLSKSCSFTLSVLGELVLMNYWALSTSRF